MTKAERIAGKAAELMKEGAAIITAAELKNGIAERIQVYFWSDDSAVMDIISKDDLVQNFPEEGVYVLDPACSDVGQVFRKVVMFEGEEDMYFRTDGKTDEADEFADVPPVLFMESVEAVCGL